MNEEKLKVAIHETGHAVVALICGHGVLSVSLKAMDSPLGTGKYLGFTKLAPFEKKPVLTMNEAIGRMSIALGGCASELLLFHRCTSLGGDDLTSALNMVDTLMQSQEFKDSAARLPVPDPGPLDEISDPTVRAVIEYQLHRCVHELERYTQLIQTIATKLHESNELTGEQVTQLFNSFVASTMR